MDKYGGTKKRNGGENFEILGKREKIYEHIWKNENTRRNKKSTNKNREGDLSMYQFQMHEQQMQQQATAAAIHNDATTDDDHTRTTTTTKIGSSKFIEK